MAKLLKTDEDLVKLRDIYCTGAARKGYRLFKGYTLPESYKEIEKGIDELEVFDDDVWLLTFPKSGTTWAQEMVWCVCNNVDLKTAKAVSGTARFPFLEMSCMFDLKPNDSLAEMKPEMFDSLSFVKKCKRPRFIKTHLPWELLPKQIRNREKNPKIVMVFRNPKDVCVSYYHHSKLLENYSGDFDLFWQLFLRDKLNYCPFFAHKQSYLQNCNNSNFLLIKYEDMKEDLTAVLKTTAEFFNVTLSQLQISTLLHHLSFDEMKQNKSVNREDVVEIRIKKLLCFNPEGKFLRSGKVGSYKAEMSEEVVLAFDRWIEEHVTSQD